MIKIYQNLLSLVGNTPIIRIPIEAIFSDISWEAVKVFGKLEMFNPLGSVKDRTALAMINEAQNSGKLLPGSVIVEPTSGNTGIGLAWISNLLGYKCKIVMPENVSKERQLILNMLGAEVVLTPAESGMRGSIEKATEILKTDKNAVMLDQFSNPANPDIHYRTTAVEIWRDLEGKIDGFLAGIGTGGTITGVGRFLKERSVSIKVVGVEPNKYPHKIGGIGAGFKPKVLDYSVIDRIVKVDDDSVLKLAIRLSREFSLFVGISSAAVLLGLYLYHKLEGLSGNWVVIFPDSAQRYLSIFGEYVV